MWQASKLTNAELLGVSCDICMQVSHDDLSSVKFRDIFTGPTYKFGLYGDSTYL